MRFRSGAKLDPSQVTDVRGRSMGGPVLAGGGGIGVVGLVIFVLYTVLSGGSGDLGALGSLDGQSVSTGPSLDARQDCRTGADANERAGLPDRRRRQQHPGVLVASVGGYTARKTVFYTDAVQTGCGAASSAGRPVLLPCRQARVHRPRLLRRAAVALRRRRAARSRRPTCSRTSTATTSRTSSARSSRARSRARTRGGSVRTELQADCFAGVWANARRRDRPDRAADPGRHQLGIDAAGAVGDDRIQERTQGQVTRRAGRTARPSSGAAGSRRATRPAARPRATRSRARSEPRTRP